MQEKVCLEGMGEKGLVDLKIGRLENWDQWQSGFKVERFGMLQGYLPTRESQALD